MGIEQWEDLCEQELEELEDLGVHVIETDSDPLARFSDLVEIYGRQTVADAYERHGKRIRDVLY